MGLHYVVHILMIKILKKNAKVTNYFTNYFINS